MLAAKIFNTVVEKALQPTMVTIMVKGLKSLFSNVREPAVADKLEPLGEARLTI